MPGIMTGHNARAPTIMPIPLKNGHNDFWFFHMRFCIAQNIFHFFSNYLQQNYPKGHVSRYSTINHWPFAFAQNCQLLLDGFQIGRFSNRSEQVKFV
jgi:hypothetical protein